MQKLWIIQQPLAGDSGKMVTRTLWSLSVVTRNLTKEQDDGYIAANTAKQSSFQQDPETRSEQIMHGRQDCQDKIKKC